MSNLLAKDPIITIIPGTPAIPPMPSLVYTQTWMLMHQNLFSTGGQLTLTPDWAAFLNVYGISFGAAGATPWLAPGVTYQCYRKSDGFLVPGLTVYATGNDGVIITQPTIALSVGIPATPDIVTSDPNPGWNASAVSIATVSATGRPYFVSFKMPDSNVGSIAGVVTAGHGENLPIWGFSMSKGVLTTFGGLTPIAHANNAVLKIIVYPKLSVVEWWVGALLVQRSAPPLIIVGPQPTLTDTFGTQAPVAAYGQADSALGAQLYLALDNVTDPVIDYSAAVSVNLNLEALSMVSGVGTPPNAASLTLRTLQMLSFANAPMVMQAMTIAAGLVPPQGSSLSLRTLGITAQASLSPFAPVLSGGVMALRALTLRTGTIIPMQMVGLKLKASNFAFSGTDMTMQAPTLAASMFTESNTDGLMFEVLAQVDTWTPTSIFAVVFDEHLGVAVGFFADQAVDAAMLSSLLLSSTETISAILSALMVSEVSVPFDVAVFSEGSVVWVVNTETGASSTYTNYSFNSFAKLDSAHFGAKADGIYSLDEADDATPMVGRLDFGTLTFGDTVKSRVSEAYVGVSSSGNLFLKVRVDGTEYVYTTNRSNPHLSTQRVKLGKGLEANAMGFQLYNDAGANFELETVEFNRVPMSRRI